MAPLRAAGPRSGQLTEADLRSRSSVSRHSPSSCAIRSRRPTTRKPGCEVQRNARLVLGEDVRLDRPHSRSVCAADEGFDEGPPDAPATGADGDIDAVLDDAGVALALRSGRQRCPADHGPVLHGHEPMLPQAAAVEFLPGGHLRLEGRGTGCDAVGPDRCDLGPVRLLAAFGSPPQQGYAPPMGDLELRAPNRSEAASIAAVLNEHSLALTGRPT